MQNISKQVIIFAVLVVLILVTTSPAVGIIKGNTTNIETIEIKFDTRSNLRSMSNNQLILRYTFTSPVIESVEIGNTFYDQLIMDNAPCVGNPGLPSLPTKGAYILLPQKTKVQDITANGKKIFLGSDFNILPCSIPVSTVSNLADTTPIPDQVIYHSKHPFPSTLFTEVGTYPCRGYILLVLALHPVQYIPSSGDLFYHNYIDITVALTADETVNSFLRNSDEDKQLVRVKVDNPSTVDTYTELYTEPMSLQQYDFLIITADSLKNSFKPLAAKHNSTGITTIIKTITEIGSSYPVDIRDYIRYAYNNWSIKYVLIGGDNNIVPARKLWVESWSGGTTTNMPSDLYYACLDGPYNYDDDGYWGEPNDGADGGDVDLMAEVYVGRACVSNSAEVNNFVDKTIAYMNSYTSFLHESLMVGEKMDNDPTWGGNYMDDLINGSMKYGYTTIGIPTSYYNINKLYDRDWPGHDWPDSEIISRINNGVHIINHMGHSDYDYNMKMSISDVYSLTNDNYCFVYSQGCNAGGFDKSYDCIAEYFTVKTNHGAFAGIWNARSGWYHSSSTSTNGPSQRFHREFWDAIFGEDLEQIGYANQDSKEDNLHIINSPCIRWCNYGLNLFGDPTLSFNSLFEIGSIKGGIGVTAEINNNGWIDLLDMNLEIIVTGGILEMIDRTISEKIDIKAKETEVVKSGILFGLGPIEVTLKAGNEEKTVEGIQIIIFTMVK